MRYLILVLFFFALNSGGVGNCYATKILTVENLRCESMVNPLGIDAKVPRFSWQIHSSERNSMQMSYRILISDAPENLKRNIGNCWDSKTVMSDQSIMVPYEGKPLSPNRKYYWKVLIQDNTGFESAWSTEAWFQTGLLTAKDWGAAQWIGYENLPDSLKIVPGIHGSGENLGKKGVNRSVVPLFRKEFDLKKKIINATLYISGLGQYEASLNGQKIGQSFMSPGWTDYDKTCLYNSYDVTKLLKEGNNVLGVVVGNGFYNINRERYRKLVIAFGYPKVKSTLKIEFSDGTFAEIASGTDWKCTPSPITYSSIYGGEDYNASLEQPGWDQSGFDDSKWKSAILATVPAGRLSAEADYPVTVNQSIQVKKIDKLSTGKYVYDFGQNGSGIVELKVKGKKGTVIKLTPGELINSQGDVNQNASGSPYFFSYTLKGDGVEVWRPKFSFYGFRYVSVEGATPSAADPKSDLPQIIGLTMLHTCNSSPKTGDFTCSNSLFNQIYSLIDWAIRSNLQSVVTDCPHREKLGWLEQTYLMGASLHYNYNLYPLYRKAIRDMIDSRTSEGLVPDIAPEYVEFEKGFRDSPEWGSAAVILPWMLWDWYRDRSIVEEALPMMQDYVAYLGTKATDNILYHGLGDWFDYGPKSPGEAQLTPKALTATAIYYYDIKLLVKMMNLCKRTADAEKLDSLAARVKASFNAKFFNSAANVYSTGSQTSMSMPLCVGLVDERNRAKVFSNLVDSIKRTKNALTAGDVGFHFLVKALEENGGSQILFDMNFRNDVPGYGFQLKKGATALTESWPALEVVSNNHLMLGHLMEWFYTGLGGIKQDTGSVAFKNIIIRPEIVGDITTASTRYLSPYGTIKSDWRIKNGVLEMQITIPSNTTASIFFPIKSEIQVLENGKKTEFFRSADGKYFCRVGSGNYIFKMKY